MKVVKAGLYNKTNRFTGMTSPRFSVSSPIYSTRSSLTPLKSSWPQRPLWTACITTMRKSACLLLLWSLQRWARWRVESCAGPQKVQAWKKTRRISSWNSASPRPTSQTGEKMRRRKRRPQSYWTTSKAWHSLVSCAWHHILCFTLSILIFKNPNALLGCVRFGPARELPLPNLEKETQKNRSFLPVLNSSQEKSEWKRWPFHFATSLILAEMGVATTTPYYRENKHSQHKVSLI